MSIGNGMPYVPGFRLDGSIEEGDVQWLQQTINTTITVNNTCLFASGFVSGNTTTFAATFAGIAMITQTITTPTALVPILTPNRNKYFWAPVGSATLATQACVGTTCNLWSTGQAVDITSTSPTAFAFQPTAIDVSAAAIAANASGYVLGRFIPASE